MTTRLSIRARPSARRSAVVGFDGVSLGVQLAAPPTNNRANDELVQTLADALNIAKSHVRIVQGRSGRRKLVEIDMPPETLRAWLSTLPIKDSEG